MTAVVIDLSRRLVAESERDRLTGFLTAIKTALGAQETFAAHDTAPTADSAAARAALERRLRAKADSRPSGRTAAEAAEELRARQGAYLVQDGNEARGSRERSS